MFGVQVKIVSKIDKENMGMEIFKGDVVDVVVNTSGIAALVGCEDSFRFAPHQYDLYLPDEEFDKLLAG